MFCLYNKTNIVNRDSTSSSSYLYFCLVEAEWLYQNWDRSVLHIDSTREPTKSISVQLYRTVRAPVHSLVLVQTTATEDVIYK